jgi:tryptophanyl-tRNA synthetase
LHPDGEAQVVKKIALSGIKPTGELHIGNYLGMIKPAFELAENYQALYFIADYHALTTVRDQKMLNHLVYDVAASLLALGLDTERITFFRQADIPEIFELTWILSCFTAKGLLNRAHAYKALVDANQAAGRQADADINAGLYNYPVLMAADILLYGSHAVPVGQDQKQHVEIARDIAIAVNNNYGKIFTLPEPLIQNTVMTIPGTDGRKMSKNYNNTIPIFADSSTLRKQVMRIVTDSKHPEEPKNPDECNVFRIYRYFASPKAIAAKRNLYLRGGLAYSDIKQELFELLQKKFAKSRDAYIDLIQEPARLDAILKQGAQKARAMAVPMMEKLRRKIGIRP